MKAMEYATALDVAPGLDGKRKFLLRQLEYASEDSRPSERAIVREMIERFNHKAEGLCRPELRIELAALAWPAPRRSAPAVTPARPSPAPRFRDPFLERFESLWAEFRSTLFNGRLPAVTIALDYRDDKRLGTFCRSQAEVWINPRILDGTHKAVRDGSGDSLGILRFAGDALLHEAIHAHEADFLGRSAGGHAGTFHAKCYELTKKLSPVRRTAIERLNIHNCEYWPDMVRPKDYYRGAVVKDRLCRG